MARLFGFSVSDTEKKSPSVVSPVPQNIEDGVDNYISSGFYGQYLDIEGVYRTEFDLIYETSDTIEEFTVEMQVHYWEAFKGSSASANGEDIS